MENGNEPQGLTLELSQKERNYISVMHDHHIKCALENCNIHSLVHVVIRLEAARVKLAHELEATTENEMGTHGKQGLCERCRWTDVDWIRSLSGEWKAEE